MSEQYVRQSDGRMVAGPDLPTPEAPKHDKRRLFVALALSALVLSGLAVLADAWNVGEDGIDAAEEPLVGAAADPGSTPGSSTTSPYRPRPVARGVAGAVASVIADVSDPVVGRAIMGTIFDSTQRVTGCTVVRIDVDTHETKRAARVAAGKLGAFAAVEYAPPEWHDQFVSVVAEVTCG